MEVSKSKWVGDPDQVSKSSSLFQMLFVFAGIEKMDVMIFRTKTVKLTRPTESNMSIPIENGALLNKVS